VVVAALLKLYVFASKEIDAAAEVLQKLR